VKLALTMAALRLSGFCAQLDYVAGTSAMRRPEEGIQRGRLNLGT
jgi:hypothetical protein